MYLPMTTQVFSFHAKQQVSFTYQTVITPDPYDGTPVCSLLLLTLQDHIVTQHTLFYDVARDAALAEIYRNRLLAGKVPPTVAGELLEEWLGDASLI